MLFLSFHSSITCDRGVEPICQTPLTRVMLGSSLAGKVSLSRILLYSPRSLVVANSSLFHDVQFSQPSLCLMSQNLWMFCLGCADDICVMVGTMRLLICCKMSPSIVYIVIETGEVIYITFTDHSETAGSITHRHTTTRTRWIRQYIVYTRPPNTP